MDQEPLRATRNGVAAPAGPGVEPATIRTRARHPDHSTIRQAMVDSWLPAVSVTQHNVQQHTGNCLDHLKSKELDTEDLISNQASHNWGCPTRVQERKGTVPFSFVLCENSPVLLWFLILSGLFVF